MGKQRNTTNELPMSDRFLVDTEAVAQECPACGQPLNRSGRCASRSCEKQFKQQTDDLIALHERLMEG